MNKKKETRGGTRKNAGAKPKYSEQTKTVAFRCPVSKVDELKSIVKSKLSEWSVKQQLTYGAMSRFALQKCSNLAQMLLANLLIARVI